MVGDKWELPPSLMSPSPPSFKPFNLLNLTSNTLPLPLFLLGTILSSPSTTLRKVARVFTFSKTICHLSPITPKKLKYVKPRLGESTLTYIVVDTPNLAYINFFVLKKVQNHNILVNKIWFFSLTIWCGFMQMKYKHMAIPNVHLKAALYMS